MKIELLKTDPSHPDFIDLVAELDKDLAIRDGDDHAFYAQFNKTGAIKNAVVLFVNDEAVGCGAFKYYEEGIAEIKRMYVKPEHRGNRYAVLILNELEQWAHAEGFMEAILETGINQPEAIKMYHRTGYTLISNYGQYEGVTTSVCFKKALNALVDNHEKMVNF